MKKQGDNYIEVNESGDPVYMWETNGDGSIEKLVVWEEKDGEEVFVVPVIEVDNEPEREEMNTIRMRKGCLSDIDGRMSVIKFPTDKKSIKIPLGVFQGQEYASVNFELDKGMELYHVVRTYPDHFSNERDEWLAVAPKMDLEKLNDSSKGLFVRKTPTSFNWGEEFNHKRYSGINVYVSRDYSDVVQNDGDQK